MTTWTQSLILTASNSPSLFLWSVPGFLHPDPSFLSASKWYSRRWNLCAFNLVLGQFHCVRTAQSLHRFSEVRLSTWFCYYESLARTRIVCNEGMALDPYARHHVCNWWMLAFIHICSLARWVVH